MSRISIYDVRFISVLNSSIIFCLVTLGRTVFESFNNLIVNLYWKDLTNFKKQNCLLRFFSVQSVHLEEAGGRVVLQVGVGLGSRLRAQGNKWKLFKSLFQCQPLHSAPCCLLELSLAVLWPFLFSGSDDSLSFLCVALISVMSACCKTYPCADLSPKDPAHSFLFLQLWWTTILSQTFLTHFLITWLSVCKWSVLLSLTVSIF